MITIDWERILSVQVRDKKQHNYYEREPGKQSQVPISGHCQDLILTNRTRTQSLLSIQALLKLT